MHGIRRQPTRARTGYRTQNAPRTRHFAVKHHHFREHVERGLIKIVYVDSKRQLADMVTRALPFTLPHPLRESNRCSVGDPFFLLSLLACLCCD